MPPKQRVGPNSLWASWIQEQADNAVNKGSRSADTYAKAARTIRSHPVLMVHPKEARELYGVGPKIVEMLSERLRRHCEETGEAMPVTVTKKKRAAANGSNDGPAAKKAKNSLIANRDRSISYESSSTDDDLPVKGKGKGKAAAKTYVPRERSGGWGILAALYSHCTLGKQKRFHVKSEIIETAQKYCDSSYTAVSSRFGDGAGASGHYTAWNSIKQLMTKLYVVESDTRPKKYALTQKGFEVAKAVAQKENMEMHDVDVASVTIEAKEHAAAMASLKPKLNATGKAKGAQLPDDENEDYDNPAPPARTQPQLQHWENIETEAAAAARREKARKDPRASNWIAGIERLVDERDRSDDERDLLGQAPSSSTGYEAFGGAGVRVGSEDAGIVANKNSGQVQGNGKESFDSLGKKPFEYLFLDSANNRVKVREDADTGMHHITYATTLKIEYRICQHLHPFRSANVHNMEEEEVFPRKNRGPEGFTRIGWLLTSKSLAKCPGFLSVSGAAGNASGSGKAPSKKAAVDDLMMGKTVRKAQDPKAMYAAPKGTAFSGGAASGSGSASTPALRLASDGDDVASFQKSKSGPLPARDAISEARARAAEKRMADSMPDISFVGTSTSVPTKKLVPSAAGPSKPRGSFATAATIPEGLPKPRASMGTMAITAMSVQPIVWPAGTYDVVLILDNREIAAKNNREGMMKRCEEAGILIEQRALAVGDALWIGRQKGTLKEVALDSILERKRLDDLCSSIKDQRFHEQKARMKNSGVQHLIYLVEDFDRHVQNYAFGQQIWTSKTQVMLLDGFHLHQTKSWQESADYLVLRTQVISNIYKRTDLSVIPECHIDRGSYIPLLESLRSNRPTETWVISYTTFQDLNDKSANLTVSNVWARMMSSFHGMSMEKVGPIIDKWPTPRDFWEAYKDRADLAMVEHMEWQTEEAERASQGGNGKGKKGKKPNPENWVSDELPSDYRAIGPALSKKIWQVYDAEEY